MPLSAFLANALLDHYLGGRPYAQPSPHVSLHTADPGLTGANEVSGGSYARQKPTFAAPANKAKALSADVLFTGMPAVTVTHVGMWDAASSGNFLQGAPLASSPSRVAVNAGDTFVLTKKDLIASLI